MAADWVDPLLEHVRTDAFSRGNRPLTYQEAVSRFGLDTTTGRAGRLVFAIAHILVDERGWPRDAAGGVAAYVVSASTGSPPTAWNDLWQGRPQDARAGARAYVRELALAD